MLAIHKLSTSSYLDKSLLPNNCLDLSLCNIKDSLQNHHGLVLGCLYNFGNMILGKIFISSPLKPYITDFGSSI